MTEYRDVLERVGDRAPMPEPAFDRILRRRDRKRRNQRISAGVVGLAVSVALILALVNVSADRSSRPIAVPTPLPSNGWIVYAAEPGNEASGSDAPRYLYLSSEGGAARRIVGSDGDALIRRCPAFSPDGSRLSYSEYASPSPGIVTLVVTALDASGDPIGSEQRIAAPTVLEPYLLCPEWSPDGRRLAYTDDRGLWVASLDGQTPVRLHDNRVSGYVHDFEWSPDGSQIAVSLLDPEGKILMVPVDGEDVRVVPGGMNGGTLTWAPDGTRLAVGRDGSWGGARNPGIRVIDVDRNVVRTLDLGDDPTMGGDPFWSPDGEHIAFVNDDGRIVLTDPVEGGTMTLPPVEVPDISRRRLGIWAVQWSPDGQRLLSIGGVRKPGLAYAVVSVSVDGTSSAVPVSPVTSGLYYTTSWDLDWQAVPS